MKNQNKIFKGLAWVSSVTVSLLSLLILLAWQYDLAWVRTVLPGGQLSNPVTSLCFMIGSLALACLFSANNHLRFTGRALGIIIFFVGIIRFAEILFVFDTGIDRWLFKEKLLKYGQQGLPNYIAPNTAIGFALLGLSFFFYHPGTNRKRILDNLLALAVLLLSFLSVVGYIYRSPEFYDVRFSIPMAFPTALSFLFLSAALLLKRSRFGIFHVFTKDYEGSKMIRFLLPFAVLIPILTGLLRLYGEHLNLYSGRFGVALFVVVIIVVFVFLIGRYSLYLNKSGCVLRREMIERKRLQEQLKRLNKHLEEEVTERTKQLIEAEEQKIILERELLHKKVAQQKLLMQAAIEGQEKEKRQIGMDLHDNINQILASTKLRLDMAISEPGCNGSLLRKSREQLVLAMNELRSLSKALVPHGIETEGIEEGIRDIIETVSLSKRIAFTTKVDTHVLKMLDTASQVMLYRIIQEQINNIIKHAEARHVDLELTERNENIILVIEDDGKGFVLGNKCPGIGLSNIKNRAEMLHGAVRLDTSPNCGCRLQVTFPITGPAVEKR